MAPICYYCQASLLENPTPTCVKCHTKFTPFSYAKTYGDSACQEWLEFVHNSIYSEAQICIKNNSTDWFILKCGEGKQCYFEDTEDNKSPPTHPFCSLVRIRSLATESHVPLPRGVRDHIDFIYRFMYLDDNGDLKAIEGLDSIVRDSYPTYMGTQIKYKYEKKGLFYDPVPYAPLPKLNFTRIIQCADNMTHIFIRPEFLTLTNTYLRKLRHLRDNYSDLKYTPQYLRICHIKGVISKEKYLEYIREEEMRRFCAIDMIAILRKWRDEFISVVQALGSSYGPTVNEKFKHLIRVWAQLRLEFFDIQAYYGFVIPTVPRIFSDDIYYRLEHSRTPLFVHVQSYRTVKTKDDIPKLVDAMFLCEYDSEIPRTIQ